MKLNLFNKSPEKLTNDTKILDPSFLPGMLKDLFNDTEFLKLLSKRIKQKFSISISLDVLRNDLSSVHMKYPTPIEQSQKESAIAQEPVERPTKIQQQRHGKFAKERQIMYETLNSYFEKGTPFNLVLCCNGARMQQDATEYIFRKIHKFNRKYAQMSIQEKHKVFELAKIRSSVDTIMDKQRSRRMNEVFKTNNWQFELHWRENGVLYDFYHIGSVS